MIPSDGVGDAVGINEIFQIADKIANGRAGSASEPVTQFLDIFTKGLEIGQAREPVRQGEQGTDWAGILREAMPVVREIFVSAAETARARRAAAAASSGVRPMPPGAPPPGSQPSGTGGVVSNPPPPGAREADAVVLDQGEQEKAIAWQAVVISLVRAIGRGSDPVEWTASLEDMLPESELANLRFASLEQIMDQIRPQAATYPVLGTPAAEAFLSRVHQELIDPSEPADE